MGGREHARPLEILALKNPGLVSNLAAAFFQATDVRLFFILGSLWRDIAREFLTPPLSDFNRLHRRRHSEEHARLAAEHVDIVHAGLGAATADTVLVHSNDTAQLLTSCGVAPAGRVRVVGTIRLDACHVHCGSHVAPVGKPSNRITFFTFWPHIGIHLDDAHAVSIDWAERGNRSETLDKVPEVAATLATERPGLEVVVKSKAPVARLSASAPALEALAESDTANLHIISKNEGRDLTLRPDAIVGLTSTVLLDARSQPDFRQSSRASTGATGRRCRPAC